MLSPEHDDGGVGEGHLLHGVEEQDHGVGAQEAPEDQEDALVPGTQEPGSGGQMGDGWIQRGTDGRTDGLIHRWKDLWMDGMMDRLMDEWKDGWMKR